MSVRLKPMWPPVFSTVPTAVSFPVPGAADRYSMLEDTVKVTSCRRVSRAIPAATSAMVNSAPPWGVPQQFRLSGCSSSSTVAVPSSTAVTFM